jgi:hypothetical protein
MRIKVSVATNKVGSKVSDILEIEDGLSFDEIEEIYKEWMYENIDGHWENIDDGEGRKDG